MEQTEVDNTFFYFISYTFWIPDIKRLIKLTFYILSIFLSEMDDWLFTIVYKLKKIEVVMEEEEEERESVRACILLQSTALD